MLHLSSPQNTHIKRIKALQEKAKRRKLDNAFCIEGEKEILHALAAGYVFEAIYIQEERLGQIDIDIFRDIEKITVSSSIFENLCYRKNTSKLIGIAKKKSHSLDQLRLPKEKGFLLLAEAPEKPGNIGALLRTADAMGVNAMILVDPITELYNPNIIRSSVGCLFSVQIGIAGIKETNEFLTKNNFNLYSAALSTKAKVYTDVAYKNNTAIAVGSEANGLSKEWLAQTATPIIIPMKGKNDSLNVSVAAGILLAEVQRQRN